MAEESPGRRGTNFKEFKQRLEQQGLNKGQLGPLNMRLDLLESFLEQTYRKPARGLAVGKGNKGENIWNFQPGSLTIVDLSCPFVDENDACSLFNICLSIFMERRNEGGRVVALDEAHKVRHKFSISSNCSCCYLLCHVLFLLDSQQFNMPLVFDDQQPRRG